VVDLAAAGEGRTRDARASAARASGLTVTAGHFIFIPAVILVGVVIGWILGSRAAKDAYAADLRRREERKNRNTTMSG
jgi:proteasome assembly chaperone (PAC2) family protein